MDGLLERLDACFGARAALAGESLRSLSAAIAREEPAGFRAWRDVAGRLYGRALNTPDLAGKLLGEEHLGGVAVNPDCLLFALQTYYALIVRCVTVELCGEAATAALDEPLFRWIGDVSSSEAATTVRKVTSLAARCCADAAPGPVAAQGDLFKRLYEGVFPRALRHALGEYYTPDWLADHVLEQAGWPGAAHTRLLDPACGSGTFLVRAIQGLRRACGAGIGRQEELEQILVRVTGFDLNPLAVLAARANYLIAVRDLLPTDGPIKVPVACRDTIGDEPPAPTLGSGKGNRFSPVAGEFTGSTGKPCAERVGALSGRLVGPFDLLVGNPPWIAWDNMPLSYRRATLPLWKHYGLLSLDGNAGRHGGAKKDLAMLLLWAAADRYLRDGGRAAMVVSQTLLHTQGAGDGFRRFRLGPEGCPLAVLRVDDLSRLRPFSGAVSCTATLLLEKGRPTVYPVPYVRWLPDANRPRGQSNVLQVEHLAEPVDPVRPGSPWFVRPRNLRTPLRDLVGPSDYTARLGANSGGANGVYWVEWIGPAPGGVRIRNLSRAGRHELKLVECVVEPDLLFPLLRWGDVARYRARPSACVLLPQDPTTRTGLSPEIMQARYPKTWDYFLHFDQLLRDRAAYQRYQQDRPFYSMYNVGPYTMAGVKVVWRRMDSRLTAAVVESVDHSPLRGRPVIPQETCVLVDCATADEAHYLCALVNSAVVGFLVSAHSVAGGKGFGTPGILQFARLRRFDATCELHRRLVAASRAAHKAGAGGAEDKGAEVGAIQRAIDTAAATLWGLDAREQQAIAQINNSFGL